MPKEVIHYLNCGHETDCKKSKIYVDCTVGGSGHATSILEKIIPNGMLIGIDQDIDAIDNANVVLKKYKQNIHLFRENFIHLPEIMNSLNISTVDGIFMDIGLSQHQLENSKRGFSFKRDEPLDMRMDIRNQTSAADIVNSLNEKELANIIFKFGEEPFSRQIARKIISARKTKRIESSLKLAQIVKSAIPTRIIAKKKTNPATRTFQALRIAVNNELSKLDFFLQNAVNLLNTGGRICILSFHSLEDRIVKNRLRQLERPCTCPPDFPMCVCNKKPTIRCLTKKPVIPDNVEIKANPMARSTKLRAAEKL